MEEGEAGGGPTEWVCHSMWYESPRYTGIVWLPIRRNEGADIECMSLNARGRPLGGIGAAYKAYVPPSGIVQMAQICFLSKFKCSSRFFMQVCFPNNNSKRPDSIIRDIHHISLKKSQNLKIKSNQKITSTHFLCQLCQRLSCAVCSPPPPAGCQ